MQARPDHNRITMQSPDKLCSGVILAQLALAAAPALLGSALVCSALAAPAAATVAPAAAAATPLAKPHSVPRTPLVAAAAAPAAAAAAAVAPTALPLARLAAVHWAGEAVGVRRGAVADPLVGPEVQVASARHLALVWAAPQAACRQRF